MSRSPRARPTRTLAPAYAAQRMYGNTWEATFRRGQTQRKEGERKRGREGRKTGKMVGGAKMEADIMR